MRGLVIALVGGLAGCFPPPHLKDAAGAGADGDAAVADSAVSEADVPAHCTSDDECAGLGALPCVVGRCQGGTCTATQVAVACDDGDPCTTADRCAGGVCAGRAFSAEEAKNWALVMTPTGDAGAQFYLSDVVVHPSGEVSVVGGLRGAYDFGHGIQLDTHGEEKPVYLRLSAGGAVLRADPLDFGVTGEFVMGHTLVRDGEGVIAVGAVQSPSPELRLYATALQGIDHEGHVEWTSAMIPGVVSKAALLGDGSLIVAAEFSEAIELPLVDGGVASLHPVGSKDSYLARIEKTGKVAWEKTWASSLMNLAPALIPIEDRLLLGFWKFGSASTGKAAGWFDGILVPQDHVGAAFFVPEDRATSATVSVPGVADPILYGGFAAGGGDVAATLITTHWDTSQPPSRISVALSRFFPNGASPRWTVPFDAPLSALMPGPVPVPLPNGDVLVVWTLVQSADQIQGWPTPIPAGETNTLFGVWSGSGQLRGAWTLAGFIGTGLVPKESMSLNLGREGVSVTADGAIYVAAWSHGAPLGPDLGSVPVPSNSAVLLRYSAAHVFGCAASSN